MSPFDAERIALWWGPGVLILIVFGFGFLRLAKYWIERSMDVKRQQMISVFGMFQTYVEQFLSAQKCQADALARLAGPVRRPRPAQRFRHPGNIVSLPHRPPHAQ